MANGNTEPGESEDTHGTYDEYTPDYGGNSEYTDAEKTLLGMAQPLKNAPLSRGQVSMLVTRIHSAMAQRAVRHRSLALGPEFQKWIDYGRAERLDPQVFAAMLMYADRATYEQHDEVSSNLLEQILTVGVDESPVPDILPVAIGGLVKAIYDRYNPSITDGLRALGKRLGALQMYESGGVTVLMALGDPVQVQVFTQDTGVVALRTHGRLNRASLTDSEKRDRQEVLREYELKRDFLESPGPEPPKKLAGWKRVFSGCQGPGKVQRTEFEFVGTFYGSRVCDYDGAACADLAPDIGSLLVF